MEVEHFHPKSLYPNEVISWENLLPICKRCNSSKGADSEPVLRALGVDADERGLLHRVVHADLLDDTAVALLAPVDDDDAVEGRELLAHALEANLDCHLVELLVLDGLARAGPR